MFCFAKETCGFDSGIEWESLIAEHNIVAVVLFDVNDACAYGISLEAGEMGSARVYELFQGELLELKNLTIAGRKPVLNLKHVELIPELSRTDLEIAMGLEAGERP